MTQHPFDRQFSEQEAAKLNAEQEAAKLNAEQELTDEDTDQVAGGIITMPITKGIGEEGGWPSKPSRWLETGSGPY